MQPMPCSCINCDRVLLLSKNEIKIINSAASFCMHFYWENEESKEAFISTSSPHPWTAIANRKKNEKHKQQFILAAHKTCHYISVFSSELNMQVHVHGIVTATAYIAWCMI